MLNKIHEGDVLEIMKKIPSETVTLIVTSPPYNLKINYGDHEDDMPWVDYLDWLSLVWKECRRVLRPGGRMAINMATITNRQKDKDKEYIRSIPMYLGNQMKEIGMLPFAEVIWYKQDAAGKKTAWGSFCSPSCPVIRSTHEYLNVFSKDQFRLEGDIEQSDIDKKDFIDWTFSVWFITPETRKMGTHPVPFPQELVKRSIKLWSYRGDVVLDPFCGSGTTPYVAKKLGRKYIGIDNCKEYIDYARDRLDNDDIFEEQFIVRSERLKKDKIIDIIDQDIFDE